MGEERDARSIGRGPGTQVEAEATVEIEPAEATVEIEPTAPEPGAAEDAAQTVSSLVDELRLLLGRLEDAVRTGDARPTDPALAHLVEFLPEIEFGPAVGTALGAIEGNERRARAAAAIRETRRRHSRSRADEQAGIDSLQASLPPPGTSRRGRFHLPPRTRPHLPPLEIRAFGRFEVRRDGDLLAPCSSRSGRLLLRYLVAASGHRADAEELMELLWPDDPPPVARHKLHCAFSALRTSLAVGLAAPRGGGYVRFVDGVYEIDPDESVETDVDEFLELHRYGRLVGGSRGLEAFETACELFRGPFLVEDRYADWAEAARRELTAGFVEMASALARQALDEGRYRRAIEWAGRAERENPTDEGVERLLIAAYAADGRRADAARQYERFRAVLAGELGVDPMPETRRLADAALHGARSDEVPDDPMESQQSRSRVEMEPRQTRGRVPPERPGLGSTSAAPKRTGGRRWR